MDKFYFTTINHTARKELDISIHEYCVADTIYHLSNNPKNKKGGWCYMENESMAEILGITARTIINIKNKLVKDDLIEKGEKGYYRATEKWFHVVIYSKDKVKKFQSSSEKISLGEVKKFHSSIYIKDNNKDTAKITLSELFKKEIGSIPKHLEKQQDKFLNYWTEGNSKKERWQKEKVFDIKKRWQRWLMNAKEWGDVKDPVEEKPVGYTQPKSFVDEMNRKQSKEEIEIANKNKKKIDDVKSKLFR